MGAAGIATARDVYMITGSASMPGTMWRPAQAGERVTYLIAADAVNPATRLNGSCEYASGGAVAASPKLDQTLRIYFSLWLRTASLR